MQPLNQFKNPGLKVLFTDIDGTLTKNGRLPSRSYDYLERLSHAGLAVIPVTGRPAGWCELIARLWPVHGVVGENGAFYFRFDGQSMKRHFLRSRKNNKEDQHRLSAIEKEVLAEVPGSAVASDQFCRLFDLAIDFAEDVKPLPAPQIQKIVEIFKRHGATAKISNIHVNGWFGDHNKISACQIYLKNEFNLSDAAMKAECAFVGDSPNDEPMFQFFPNSFAVANIREFEKTLKYHPTYISKSDEADGFCEIAKHLLA